MCNGFTTSLRSGGKHAMIARDLCHHPAPQAPSSIILQKNKAHVNMLHAVGGALGVVNERTFDGRLRRYGFALKSLAAVSGCHPGVCDGTISHRLLLLRRADLGSANGQF